jgi:hypothetical protein
MPYDERDDFFHQFEYWTLTGTKLDMKALWEEAQAIAIKECQEKEQWRKDHPLPLVWKKDKKGNAVLRTNRNRSALRPHPRGVLQRIIRKLNYEQRQQDLGLHAVGMQDQGDTLLKDEPGVCTLLELMRGCSPATAGESYSGVIHFADSEVW